jgi:hypothetical protein
VEEINVIEPTLSSEAGHCYSFVSALIKANSGSLPLRLWVNRRAEMEFDDSHVEVRKHFFRWLRRTQGYWLYRELLAAPGKLFLSTATYTDLRLFDKAARGTVPPRKAYFYVHWFNSSAAKLRQLRRIAARQPNLVIFGPTPTVVDVFREAGFAGAKVIPYPISPRQTPQAVGKQEFRHLLFAGAARRDKGFQQVVDLVEHLHLQQSSIPVTIQMSAAHFGKYDADTLADIQRLKDTPYRYLELLTQTLSVAGYEALFPGALALQLYSANDFSDRISGVTLDAFSGGCPVLTTAGTWIARMVERFDAGTVTAETSPQQILGKIVGIIAAYDRYAANAAIAGRALQQENSASMLYEALTE